MNAILIQTLMQPYTCSSSVSVHKHNCNVKPSSQSRPGLPIPHLFVVSGLFLGGDRDFGDESGSSSPWFVDCSFGWGGSIWELHIPAVRRLLLPHGLEVLLPVLSGRSLHVSQVQSVEKLPYHQQSISGSWSMLTITHTISLTHTQI